ncbi:DUF4240 domain-containing protein [Phaeodactylibacter xiamenensis]|uniref:DUF4240 domain-containing protein n=1 Tax=Phaeodactylibacter xiamenensis TaxID=1524460 RepID=UPI003CCBED17
MSTAERKLRLTKILLETDDEATLQAVEHTLAEQHERLARYWDVIHALDWSKEGDDAAVLAPAIAQLTQFQEADILGFYDWFAGQLYHLDGRDYAEASVAEDESLSADLFLYARCAVLANGRTFYERVRANPALFPKDLYFDALLRLPEADYEQRTGQSLPRAPKYIYETGFNVEGWGCVHNKLHFLNSLPAFAVCLSWISWSRAGSSTPAAIGLKCRGLPLCFVQFVIHTVGIESGRINKKRLS